MLKKSYVNKLCGLNGENETIQSAKINMISWIGWWLGSGNQSKKSGGSMRDWACNRRPKWVNYWDDVWLPVKEREQMESSRSMSPNRVVFVGSMCVCCVTDWRRMKDDNLDPNQIKQRRNQEGKITSGPTTHFLHSRVHTINRVGGLANERKRNSPSARFRLVIDDGMVERIDKENER